MRRLPAALAALLLNTFAATASFAAPPPTAPGSAAPALSPASPANDAQKEEARSHFELGLSHFDRGEWSAALAEFMRARELYPTRSATKNAAVCLRKENRFDEALDMFEALDHDYADLSETDRALARQEIAELKRSVGTLAIHAAEPGASVTIDGRSRGNSPLPGPLRIGVGAHVVRVYKEGFVPFEVRVEISSGQAASVDANLRALTRSGRLRVVEQSGKTLDVVVDDAVVGKTPWEGNVAPGEHTVLLRGEGNLGTQPISAPVTAERDTPLTLSAEELDAGARIEPTPGGALVAVDGVAVGRGIWEGKLRPGPHRFEATAEGFLPAARQVVLATREREVFTLALDRDPTSPLWGTKARPHFVVELEGSFAVVPAAGGDLASSCTGACSSSPPAGGLGLIGAGYQLPQGLGFGVQGGYLGFAETVQGRPAQIVGPQLRSSDSGTLRDRISAGGLLLGASVSYHRGETWPLTLRLGVGAYLSTLRDDRSGDFTTSAGANPPNAPYSVSLSESHAATYLYAAPEARIGRRFGDHLELSLGVALFVLTALSQPSWTDEKLVLAAPAGHQGDGLGRFGTQTLTGAFVFAVAPGLAARYEF